MTEELQAQSREFQAQRGEIQQFIAGGGGKDIKKQVEQVSAAMVGIRAGVAKFLSSGKTMDPTNMDIDGIDSAGLESATYKDTYRTKQGRIKPILEGQGSHLVPETNLDTIPALLDKLAQDTAPFNNTERRALGNLSYTITQTKYLLTNAITTHDGDRDGPITSEMAVAAHKALHVIEKDIDPKLEQMQDKLVAFEQSYRVRHGNTAYLDFLAELKPEPVAKKPSRSGFMPKAGYIATALGGAILGGRRRGGVSPDNGSPE